MDESSITYNLLFTFTYDKEGKSFSLREWSVDFVEALLKKYSLAEAIERAAFSCANCRYKLAFEMGLPWGKSEDELRREPKGCKFCLNTTNPNCDEQQKGICTGST